MLRSNNKVRDNLLAVTRMLSQEFSFINYSHLYLTNGLTLWFSLGHIVNHSVHLLHRFYISRFIHDMYHMSNATG